MPTHRKRAGFSIRELIVVIVISVLGFGIAVPLISISRANRARNECSDNLRQIGLALHNYDGRHTRYPAASQNLTLSSSFDPARGSRPGDASGGESTTGYSWIVFVLPMIEETNLYNAISQRSNRFTDSKGPFNPTIVYGSATYQHCSCVSIPALVCPSWAGDGYTTSNTTIDSTVDGPPPGYGAPEYVKSDSSMPGTGTQKFTGRVGVTNYKAMVGTHMRGGVPVGNGGLALGPMGLTANAISDGTSKTIFVCETKECGYASWYDGTLNWLVGNDPNQPPPGTDDKPPWTGASLAFNRGFNPKMPGSVPYLKKVLTANSPINDVWWGPSSDHSGGIVNHVFGDGHTLGVTEDVDATFYLGLVTRDGSEPIDDVLYFPGQTTATSGGGR